MLTVNKNSHESLENDQDDFSDNNIDQTYDEEERKICIDVTVSQKENKNNLQKSCNKISP